MNLNSKYYYTRIIIIQHLIVILFLFHYFSNDNVKRKNLSWMLTCIIPLEQLKDRRLHIFCLVNCLYTLGYYVPLDFLPDSMVKEHGISPIQAGSIVSFYGISSIIGRFSGGMIANYMQDIAISLTSVCMIFLGTSCVGMALSNLYWQFVICVCIYGIFLGMFSSLRPISLVDMFGVESLKASYGIIMFFNGISTLLGAPMAGWLKVLWGTYYYAFFITAGIFYSGGVLALTLLLKYQRDEDISIYDSI